MLTLASVVIGVFGCLLLTVSPPFGILCMAIGALAFVRGNRLAATKREDQKHQEMLAAIRQQSSETRK